MSISIAKPQIFTASQPHIPFPKPFPKFPSASATSPPHIKLLYLTPPKNFTLQKEKQGQGPLKKHKKSFPGSEIFVYAVITRYSFFKRVEILHVPTHSNQLYISSSENLPLFEESIYVIASHICLLKKKFDKTSVKCKKSTPVIFHLKKFVQQTHS